MATVTYKCPTCGAAVEYDAEKRQFVCSACGTVLDQAAFLDETDTYSDSATAGGVIYTCPTCGAEVVTDSTTAATNCYYCHNPVVLAGRLSKELEPHIIIPFTISDNAAKTKFAEWIKGKKYLPKDFYYEGQIEELRGVYFPYWVADYRGSGAFDGAGNIVTTTTTSREIITRTDTYRVIREGTIEYRNVMRSALKKADRKLSDGVHPYNLNELQAFSMPYLSGFFAEKRDIEDEEISPDIEKEICGYTQNLLTRGARYSSLRGKTSTQLKQKRYRYALFPAWVMTYRATEGELFYFAMNGQTGKACGRLPVSKGRLFARSILFFVIAFILLCLGGYAIW